MTLICKARFSREWTRNNANYKTQLFLLIRAIRAWFLLTGEISDISVISCEFYANRTFTSARLAR